MKNKRKSRIIATAISLGMISCTFTGCGADPTEEYKAEVEKLTSISSLENGTVKLNVSLDFADKDEVLSLDNLMSAPDTSEFDINFGAIASWAGDASSASVLINNENLFILSGNTDKLYIDLTKIGEVLNSADQDAEIPPMVSDLFTVIEFDTAEVNDLLDSSLGEQDSVDVDNLNENLVATLTDDDFIEVIKSLGDKAVKVDNGIEITDISKDDIENIVNALKDSANEHGLESLTSSLDDYSSLSEQTDDIESDDTETETDTTDTTDTTDIPKVNYRLTYNQKSLSQTHTLEFVKENDDKLTLVFEVNDTADGFVDLSNDAKTFKDITGYSLSEFIESIGSMFSPGYEDDAEYVTGDFDDTSESGDLKYEFKAEDFEYADSEHTDPEHTADDVTPLN